MTGAMLIAAERQRQINVEGFHWVHDDAHGQAELVRAAGCYLRAALFQCHVPPDPRRREGFAWPWNADCWKPCPGPIPNLVKAGALIAAEIDRLQRAQANTPRRT